MTLDSTKGTSLGAAAEPASDSSKNDPSKMAEAEKTLDDLILSLKAKLVRSRKDETKKPSNSNRRERHILSEKYALSRDRLRHRSRDVKLRVRQRSDDDRSRDVSRDLTRDRSHDRWRRNDFSRGPSRGASCVPSREQSRDTWSDVTMTRKHPAVNNGDISKNISGRLNLNSLTERMAGNKRSFEKKVDFRDKTKLTQQTKVDKIIETETPETRKLKQTRKSEKNPRFLSRAERLSQLNRSGKGSTDKDNLGSINKRQLPFANKLQLKTVQLSPVRLNCNRQLTDVVANDSQAEGRRKKKRKYLKTYCKDVSEIRRSENPRTRRATEGSTHPYSVDKETELIRLKTDRLRLDQFRGTLRDYASSVLATQSRLRGLIRDLSNTSPSTLLWQGDDLKVQSSPGQADCHGNENCDGEVGNSCHGDDEDGSGRYGDDEEGSGCHGDDEYENGCHGDDRYETDDRRDHDSGKSNDGDETNDNSYYGDSNSEQNGDDNDSNGSHGDAEDETGSHDDDNDDNGSACHDEDRNGDHGDGEEGCYGDDKDGNGDHGDGEDGDGEDGEDGCYGDNKDGNGDHGDDDEENVRHGDAGDGSDDCDEGNCGKSTDGDKIVDQTCSSDHGNAEDYSGCHGDVNGETRGLSEPVADEFRMQDEAEMLEADTEAALSKAESSLLTSSISDLSAPALLPQTLISESLDPANPDADSPPILKSIEELYGRTQPSDKVTQLTDQLFPVTGWSASASIDHASVDSLFPVNSEISSKVGADALCTGSAKIDVGFRSLEANSSSPGSNEQLENYPAPLSKENLEGYSSVVSKEQFDRQVDPGQIHWSPGSKEQLVNHSSLVSNEQIVNNSSLVSKEDLINQTDPGQIPWSPGSKSHLERQTCPEPIYLSQVSKEHLSSKIEAGFPLVSSILTGISEKQEKRDDRMGPSCLGGKPDPETVRARYAKAISVFQQLTSLLSVRRKSKMMVDAKLERLRRELFRLKVTYFMEKSKIVEEKKLAKNNEGCTGDVYVDGSREERRLDSSNRQLNATCRSDYSPSTSDKPPAVTAEFTEEEMLKLLYRSDKDQTKDGAEYRPGLSPPGMLYTDESSAVDLSTKVSGKPEASDLKSDRRWTQDVSRQGLEYPASAANGMSTSALHRHVRSSDGNAARNNGEGGVGISDGLRGRVEEASTADFDRRLSADVRDDCSVRVLDLASDNNSQVSLCPKKRLLRETYRGQTEQKWDSVADEATHLDRVEPGVHRLQETMIPDTPQVGFYEQQSRLAFPRPGRDFQTSPPPPRRSLPAASNSSSQKIAVVAAKLREAETHVLSAQTEKLLTDASEPGRKRRMVSKDIAYYQPDLSLPLYRSDYSNRDPDISGPTLLDKVNTAYKTKVATAIQTNGGSYSFDLPRKLLVNRAVNQPQRTPEFHHTQLKQPQVEASPFRSSNPFPQFSNSGSLPAELRRGVHPSGVSQWRAAVLDSNRSRGFGPEIALNYPPGAYLSPSGCVLPNYGFPKEPRGDLSYPGYLAHSSFDSSIVDRRRSGMLELRPPAPPEPLFFSSSVRAHPEDRGLLFSMGDTGQLLSSHGAVMSPSGIPGYYRLPSGAYYGNSVFSPEMYIANTKNHYEVTQR